MKKIIVVSMFVLLMVVISGCSTAKTRAIEGAVIGGVIGAGAGYGIGQGGHHGAEGAGIGAAAGALTGAFVGSQIEKPQSKQTVQGYNPNQMSVQQIIDLSKQGANEDVIIDKIRLTNSKFALSDSDVASLQQQGVSSRVIAAMQGA